MSDIMEQWRTCTTWERVRAGSGAVIFLLLAITVIITG